MIMSCIPDLRSQEESTVPSYIVQSNSFTVADQGSEAESSEEEDDERSDPFSVSSSEYSYSSDSDDDVYCYDEDAISVITQQMPPLIAHPPQVLEPCHHITVLPGLPISVRHKGYWIVGDNINKHIHKRHQRLDRRTQSIHYFHAYAVENHIDVSEYSDKTTRDDRY